MSVIDKPYETARAVCALSEVALVKSVDERGRTSYIASRWNLCREFHELDDVMAWLKRVAGPSA